MSGASGSGHGGRVGFGQRGRGWPRAPVGGGAEPEAHASPALPYGIEELFCEFRDLSVL